MSARTVHGVKIAVNAGFVVVTQPGGLPRYMVADKIECAYPCFLLPDGWVARVMGGSLKLTIALDLGDQGLVRGVDTPGAKAAVAVADALMNAIIEARTFRRG